MAKPARSSPAPVSPALSTSADEARQLDRIIHERLRLAIVAALAVTEPLTFTDLRSMLSASDGNLSVHVHKLEEAGYVRSSKTFDGRLSRTDYRLTGAGRKALKQYLDHMEALIRTMRG